jgi:hypothetical protein
MIWIPLWKRICCPIVLKLLRQSNTAKQQAVSLLQAGLQMLSQIALITARTSEMENNAKCQRGSIG